MIYKYKRNDLGYTCSWERKHHRGYNNMAATKRKELAAELYGKKPQS